MRKTYEKCIDCGMPKTTRSQQRSPRCLDCSKTKRKYAGRKNRYFTCIDCGSPKITPKQQARAKCRKCSHMHPDTPKFFDTCQSCGKTKTKNASELCSSCAHKKVWANPSYKNRMVEAWENEERRKKASETLKKNWGNTESRERNRQSIIKSWENNEERRQEASKRQLTYWHGKDKKHVLYDHCQQCGKKKARNDRTLCKSCVGIKRMTGTFLNINREYPYNWNNNFKEAIRDRDNRHCVLCGKAESTSHRKLDVHHTTYQKDDLNPDRLVSLCHKCHLRTNWHREYWQTFFAMMRHQHLQDWQHGVTVASVG